MVAADKTVGVELATITAMFPAHGSGFKPDIISINLARSKIPG
jgi:hypothetical protein